MNDIVYRTNLDPFVVVWIADKMTAEPLIAKECELHEQISSGIPDWNARVNLVLRSVEHSDAVQAIVKRITPWVTTCIWIILASAVLCVMLACLRETFETEASAIRVCKTMGGGDIRKATRPLHENVSSLAGYCKMLRL